MIGTPSRAALVVASAVLVAAAPPPDIAKAVYLTDVNPAAKCLDGSPGYYYIRAAPPGGANATKWVMHIQGGGWCISEASCASRSLGYLGSSSRNVTNYTDTADFANVECNNKGCGALMLNDPSINEFTADWNAVFLRYCDGMAFAGNLTAPHVTSTGQRLWFRGLETLAGTFASLARDHALGDATVVITNGASAGGHATWLHADRMTDMIHDANAMSGNPAATVVALPDSGYWPDDPAKRFSTMFRSWFALQGGVTDGLPKHCKDLRTNVTRCLYPEYFADEITTRLFPLQSLYDPDQHKEGKLPAQVNAHGDWLLASMNRTVFGTERPGGLSNGGWIHSCTRHCGAELLMIDGFTAPTALESLFRGERGLFVDHKPFPCKACCNDAPYPPPHREL